MGVCDERKGVSPPQEGSPATSHPGPGGEEVDHSLDQARALPPPGHGVGVSGVINPAVVLVGGHDTCRKRKGTLHPAAQPRFGMALCPSSGRWLGKENPPVTSRLPTG